MLSKILEILDNASNKVQETDTDDIRKKNNFRNSRFMTKTQALKVASIIMRTRHDVVRND